MKDTFLSIDLHFWNKMPVDWALIERAVSVVPRRDVCVVIHHRNVLFQTRRYDAECTRLVNLDCCADLAGADELYIDGISPRHADTRTFEFSDETWGDLVSFSDPQEFIWAHPYVDCPSNESCRPDCFIRFVEDIPFEQIPAPSTNRTYWHRLSHYLASPLDYGIELSRVRAVAIALSPSMDFPAPLFELMRSYKLQLFDSLGAPVSRQVPQSA